MYDVHHHGDSHPVSLVHQVLEFVRGSETRTHGEEIRNLVAEGTIVRMFLERHYLNCVISKLLDPRKHIQAEFVEATFRSSELIPMWHS